MKTNWTPASTKPDCDITVLCWWQDEWFAGWWDDADECWRACDTGAPAQVSHWADVEGPV